MDDNAHKTCWGVTAKAAFGFACIILLTWLFSGADSLAVVAASS